MSKTIILNPEVIAQVLHHNEVDVYTLWAISKLVDVNNSGIVPIEEIINISKIVFQHSSSVVYAKIKKTVPNCLKRSSLIVLMIFAKIWCLKRQWSL
jgi:hypothetical protein